MKGRRGAPLFVKFFVVRAAPAPSWTHPDADLAGYDLYLGLAESGFKLNSELLTAATYTDRFVSRRSSRSLRPWE